MAGKNKNTKQAEAEVEKEKQEATLGNNISSLENANKKRNGSGSGGSSGGGSGTYNVYNSYNSSDGGENNGTNGSSGSNGNNGNSNGLNQNKSNADRYNDQIVNEWERTLENNRKGTDKYTSEQGKKKSVDATKGRTREGYESLDTVSKEKARAKRNLKLAEQENKRYQEFLSDREAFKELGKKLRGGIKKGYGDYDSKSLESEANQASEDKEYWQRLADTGNTEDEKWAFDRSLGSSKEYQKYADEAQKKFDEVQKKIEEGKTFQENMGELHDLMEKQGKLLGWQIDEYGKWVEKAGTQTNKYQAEIARNLFGKLNQVMEDGKISKEEIGIINDIYDNIGKLAEEERLADEKIQDAERKFDSADAKFSYFLFDQIKSWAVFLMGMSQGNPQMAYSAMEQFNKKIADAEAGFTANRINAFSKNDVNEITGKSDAQYSMEQIIPEIDKAILDGKIHVNDRARAVEGLEKAFEEYKRYMSEGGHEDFATWFASQQTSGNDWVSVIRMLVSAGALNWDSLSNFFSGDGSTGTGTGSGSGSGSSSSFWTGRGSSSIDKEQSLDPRNLLNTNGRFGKLAKELLEKGKKQSDETMLLRDKANTVGNALASRLGGRGAAPQGTGNAAPVNTSWGNA